MGGGGSPTMSSSSNTQTAQQSSQDPWAGLQRPAVEAIGLARGLANQPQAQFPYVWNPGTQYPNLLSMGDAYAPFDLPHLYGNMEQAASYNTGGQQTYQGGGAGTTGATPAGTGTYPDMSGYAGQFGAYTPYNFGAYGASPAYGAAPMTGAGGGSDYTAGNYQTYPEGYFQNFLTGTTTPNTNYLPYVSQVAPLNQLQQLGLQQTAQIAAAGDPLAASATGMLSDTLQGKYLDPSTNPWLQSTYQAAADPVMKNFLNAVYPGLRSSAAQAGQFGGSTDQLLQGQAQYNLGKTLGDLGTGIFGQNYQAERANQLKGALEAPAISAEAFTYPQALVGAGSIYQNQAQTQLQDMVNQWAQKANYPQTMLQDYAAILSGSPLQGYGTSAGTGSTFSRTTQPNPYYVSPGNQILGGVTSGMGMGMSGLGALMALGIL